MKRHKNPRRIRKIRRKENKQKKWYWLLAALAILVALIYFFGNTLTTMLYGKITDEVTVTVAWNPHSTADMMARAMAGAADTPLKLENLPGAHGANAMNAVYATDRNETRLLSTSLSAFVTSEAMGFGESSHRDWAAWLCAFSPALIIVPADSPYQTIDQLIAALRQNPGNLRCANAGFGTVGSAAAELLGTRALLEFDHIDCAGSGPAANAILNGEADFAVLLSTEVKDRLRSEELKALASFAEEDIILDEIIVTSIAGIRDSLDEILPFGEYYGFFIPDDINFSRLMGMDGLLKTVSSGENFEPFLEQSGIIALNPSRRNSEQTIERMASLLCRTLYGMGYLPNIPDSIIAIQ